MWTLALLAACGDKQAPSTTAPAAPAARPDVVIVTLDTTRADRIGAYGYADARTPTIDAFAREGLRFDHARSPLPLTIPAHASLFTGLYPYHTHIRSNGDNVLSGEFTTVAEHFKKAGYQTAASVAAYVTTRQWGFAQGFDAYYDSMPQPEGEGADRNFWHTERSGDEVVDDILGWMAGVRTDQPVFVWVHLYDAHFPYVVRDAYKETLANRPYDAELAFVDAQIKRLKDGFAKRDAVVWSLIGDHGESLGDHGETSHGLYTYDATQHVPWILSGPGITPGVVNEPVSTVSLTPTLLKIAGIPVPDGLDAPAEPGGAVLPTYSESYQLTDRFRIAPHRALTDGTWKLIATPKPELYDLATDPAELTNVADAHPDVVTALRAKLDAVGAAPPGAATEMDAETLQQLASLGYVGGGGMAGVDFDTLPDPKDYQELIKGVQTLERRTSGKSKEESLKAVEELLALKPDAFELRMRKATTLGMLGRTDEAQAFVKETAAMFPEQTRPWVMLSTTALIRKDTKAAVEYGRKALEAGPTDGPAQEALLDALLRDRQVEEAVKLGTMWMKANPSNAGVAALMGRYYLATRDFKNAEINLRVAAASANPRRGARVELAALGIAAKQRDAAYQLLRAEIKDYPGNLLAMRMLVRMLEEDRNWSEARTQLVTLTRMRPKDPTWQLHLAQVQFNLDDYKAARQTLDGALALAPDDPDIVLLDANLLVKEGKRPEGQKQWERATQLNEARTKAAAEAEAAKKAAAGKATPATPAPGAKP